MEEVTVSHDELVFLIRQRQPEALTLLETLMQTKMIHYVRRLRAAHRKCLLDEHDLLSLAYQTLYLAIDSYQPDKVHFDAYFHVLLERELMHALRKFNQPHHHWLDYAVSLDEPVDEGASLAELVGEEDAYLHRQKHSVFVQLLEQEDDLDWEQRTVIVLFQRGYSLKEIGNRIQKNYRQVARMLKQLQPFLIGTHPTR
jgi:RNA polymerase sigma factor (sigma-70 family)